MDVTKKHSTIGYSVFYSTHELIKDQLPSLFSEGSVIFTSLHIEEEFEPDYAAKSKTMLRSLQNMGYRILCDVSKRTLEVFSCSSILELQKELEIDMLRLDYGFSVEEMLAISKQVTLCVNASTLHARDVRALLEANSDTLFLHNFYPRPETGLDDDTFQRINSTIRNIGKELSIDVKIGAFVHGESTLRGPIFEGLVTLEEHRYSPSYVSYLDLVLRYEISDVYVGDGIVTASTRYRIQDFIKKGVIVLPAELAPGYHHYYEKVFTIRPDSPKPLKRFQESREYATQGPAVYPENCTERPRGSITIDNIHYKRYSGELMITAKDFPADEKVNVIGSVIPKYLPLLDLLDNGMQVQLIREE